MERQFIQSFVDEFLLNHQNGVGIHPNYNRTLKSTLQKYPLFRDPPSKNQLYVLYQDAVLHKYIQSNPIIDNLLLTRTCRSWSGVVPISFSLDGRAFTCAYDCSFCPNECKANGAKEDIARSYLSNEGGFTRGSLEDFSTYRQMWRRFAELESMGHLIDKLEVIPLGGTWGCIDVDRRRQYIQEIFYAANTYPLIKSDSQLREYFEEWMCKKPFLNQMSFDKRIIQMMQTLRPMKSLQEEKDIHQFAKTCRVIGIVLETRPDKINRFTLQELRSQGCTRIQMGIQHINDEILERNNRRHDVATTVKAIRYSRDAGYKVDGHLMPDLPFTTLQDDYEMVNRVFLGDDLQVDYCKIYPCLDLPYTQIRKWKESGIWKPIAETDFESFMTFLCYTMSIVPPWVRVNRVQRDFLEATERNGGLGFVSETIKTNLQQMVTDKMKQLGLRCRDIRSREIRNRIIDPETSRLYIRNYRASNATEYFISVEYPKSSMDDDCYLLGLCRLRIPDASWKDERHYIHPFRNHSVKWAWIRELHVYGMVTNVANGNIQHRGIGRFLMEVAESIAHLYQCNKLAVISGVGVRRYYEMLGYQLESQGEYMIKNVKQQWKTCLFGKTYLLSDIQTLVSNTTIYKKYHNNVSRPLRLSMTQYKKNNYSEIQHGEPQCLIIQPCMKRIAKISFIFIIMFIIFILYILY